MREFRRAFAMMLLACGFPIKNFGNDRAFISVMTRVKKRYCMRSIQHCMQQTTTKRGKTDAINHRSIQMFGIIHHSLIQTTLGFA